VLDNVQDVDCAANGESMAVVRLRFRKLSSGWTSVEGILWSPAGDEIWFTSSESGSAGARTP
jgi:hypothetical protein